MEAGVGRRGGRERRALVLYGYGVLSPSWGGAGGCILAHTECAFLLGRVALVTALAGRSSTASRRRSRQQQRLGALLSAIAAHSG